jgi:hypothetical protein
MPEVGDRVRVESTKVGQARREGVVTGVVGRLLRIKWSTGEESTVVPGPGAVAVIGKVRGSSGRKASVPAKVSKATKSAEKNAKSNESPFRKEDPCSLLSTT